MVIFQEVSKQTTHRWVRPRECASLEGWLWWHWNINLRVSGREQSGTPKETGTRVFGFESVTIYEYERLEVK